MTSGRRTDTKTCQSCGRVMTWRKSWERNWDEIRYCSQGCRRRKVTEVDRMLEVEILRLLDGRHGTICPSEAARAVAADVAAADRGSAGDDWRDLMEPARRAARRLVDVGEVQITQQGRVVDPSTARGPIRIRRVAR